MILFQERNWEQEWSTTSAFKMGNQGACSWSKGCSLSWMD